MWRRRVEERGAVFASTVVVIGVSILLASLVIDVGADRIARKDMQAVADVVALDVTRQLDGRVTSAYNTSTLTAAKNNSLARNQSSLNDIVPADVTYELWVADSITGAPIRAAGASDIPNAVKVTASGTAGFRFLPSTDQAKPSRSAIAVIDPPAACIAAGSTLADLTPGGTLDRLLGALIGETRLTVLSPNGLVDLNTGVKLLDLAAQLGVGTVNELATTNIGARNFLIAAATVLNNSGSVAAANVLNLVAAKIPSGQTINLGEILNLNLGQGSAAAAKIDVLSLVGATLMVSNKDHFIDLGVPVTVPGLANVNVKMTIIEAPQLACGPVGTRAETAQIRLDIRAKVVDSAVLALVGSVTLEAMINVADGSGTITQLRCGLPNSTMSVNAQTAVARLFAGLDVSLLLGLTGVLLEVPEKAARPHGATIATTASQTLNFTFPSNASVLPPAQTAGTVLGSLGLATITPLKASIKVGLAIPLGPLLSGVLIPVLALVDPLLTALVSPLLAALGLRLGTVDIAPISQVACNQPSLRQ